jgi:hypothetical protein
MRQLGDILQYGILIHPSVVTVTRVVRVQLMLKFNTYPPLRRAMRKGIKPISLLRMMG